jgi:hypothetical protein
MTDPWHHGYAGARSHASDDGVVEIEFHDLVGTTLALASQFSRQRR